MQRILQRAIKPLLFTFTCLVPIVAQAQVDSVKTGETEITIGVGDANDLPMLDTVNLSAVPPAGSIEFTGSIRDSKNATLPYISVTVPGYASSMTDSVGNFTIYIPSTTATLFINSPGYQAKEVAIKGRGRVDIQLNDETAPTVYYQHNSPLGQKSNSNTTTAAVSINTINNGWQSTADAPENYLQGKVVGLNLTRRSSTQGIGSAMFLRGFSSLNSTNQPLVIVDDVVYDMNDYGGSIINDYYANPLSYIDIKDIDNITVIKDAASLYGSKAANGVILIKTMRAKEQATKIDFTAYTGINFAPKNIPVMGPDEHRIYQSEILQSQGYSTDYIQAQPYLSDDVKSPTYYQYHNTTDWQREVLKNSTSSNYYLKVTGGDNIAKLGLSMGYSNLKGIIKNTGMQRFNTRFNADLNMSPKLTVKTTLSFAYAEGKLKDEGIENRANPLLVALIKSPSLNTHEVSSEGSVSPNLADADIFNVSNPTAIAQKINEQNKRHRFFGSIKFNYAFTKHLSAFTTVALTYDKVRESLFFPEGSILPDTLANAIAFRKMGSQVQRYFALFNDTRLTYSKTFRNVHALTVNAGLRYLSNQSETDTGIGYNSATDAFQTIGTGVNILRNVGGDMGRWTWLNYYASIDYTLNAKYMLTVATAVDGSSRFGKEAKDGINLFSNKFGVFPSVAVGWMLSSENFMQNVNFIQMLKLRASYGLTGNDDIGNYNSRLYYTPKSAVGILGLVRGNLSNTALQWETNKKFNVGLDLAILNERVMVTLDVFSNRTENMVTTEALPSISGFDSKRTNGGGMQTKGFEVGLNSRILNNTLTWDVGINVATYRNMITRLPVNEYTTDYAGATIQTKVGQPVGVFYGYKTHGVFTSSAEANAYGYVKENANGSFTPYQGGDIKFDDVNPDQVINASDRVVIGNPNPKFTGGVTSRVAWNKFSLETLFTFSYGNDVYNYIRARLESGSSMDNQSPRVINRWRADGQLTDVPRAAYGDPMGNSQFSDRWIEDGSYLRLRTVTLSYNKPLLSNYFKYATFYITGNNLLTFTKYLGYDPEFSASNDVLRQGIDIGQAPQFKSFILGVRLGF